MGNNFYDCGFACRGSFRKTMIVFKSVLSNKCLFQIKQQSNCFFVSEKSMILSRYLNDWDRNLRVAVEQVFESSQKGKRIRFRWKHYQLHCDFLSCSIWMSFLSIFECTNDYKKNSNPKR